MTNAETVRKLIAALMEELTPDVLQHLKQFFQEADPLDGLPSLFPPTNPPEETTADEQVTS